MSVLLIAATDKCSTVKVWLTLATFPWFTKLSQYYIPLPKHAHPPCRYITAFDKIYQTFPMLVLPVTNAGVIKL